jgi:hypothetical protein
MEKCDRLIVGAVLGSDASRLLECVPKKVAMHTLAWAQCVLLGQCTHATLVSLELNALALLP